MLPQHSSQLKKNVPQLKATSKAAALHKVMQDTSGDNVCFAMLLYPISGATAPGCQLHGFTCKLALAG